MLMLCCRRICGTTQAHSLVVLRRALVAAKCYYGMRLVSDGLAKWRPTCTKDPSSVPCAVVGQRACSWTVLEDNDPTGFKSTAGKNAKRESKIKVFAIPKRSPDLNVCDYAL